MQPSQQAIVTRRAGRTRGWPAWTLVVVELFVVCQAVYGGVNLARDTWHLPTAWLGRTPFTTWVGPGVVLVATVALPHLLAAVPVVALPHRPQLGILAGWLAGASLLLWIAVQLALMQVYFFLQPVIAVVGLVEIGLALAWRHRLTSPARAGSA